MTDKQMIIDGIDVNGCTHKKNDACMAITDLSGDFCHYCDEEIMKDCYYKQLKRAENQIVELNKKVEAKEQEYEELRQYHNKCCEEFEKEKKEWLEKYNQVSRDFYNGEYCDKENCSLLKTKEQECEELKSYYELYRQEQELIKKIHAVVNSHPNYGIELSKNGYIDKDERLSFLEIDKQIELIFNEQTQQLNQLKADRDEALKQLEFVRTLNTVKESEIRKLSKALTEIKEIAEKCRSSLYGYDQERYPKQILQKISEVEDDNR